MRLPHKRVLYATASVLIAIMVVAVILEEQPHIGFISEREASHLLGRNYTMKTTTAVPPYSFKGVVKAMSVSYMNPNSSTSGSVAISVSVFTNGNSASSAYWQITNPFEGDKLVTVNMSYRGFQFSFFDSKNLSKSGGPYVSDIWGFNGKYFLNVNVYGLKLDRNATVELVYAQIDAMVNL